MQKKIAVAVVVTGHRVLMVRRRKKEGLLQWQFPAGCIESSESELQAGAREVLEETGVHCRPRSVLGRRLHPDTGREVAYGVFDYVSGEASVRDPDELDAVEWMEPGRVSRVVTSNLFPGLKRFLQGLPGSG